MGKDIRFTFIREKGFLYGGNIQEGKFPQDNGNGGLQDTGLPRHFKLPEERSKWAKMLGNSVSVPIIGLLVRQIIKTGVFDV